MCIVRQTLTAIAILTCTVAIVLASAQSSNCGGNSAALYVCRTYSQHLLARMIEQNVPLEVGATPNALTADLDSGQLADLFQSMSGTAMYSVRDPDAEFVPTDHDVLIVCDTQFGNMPQPTLWNLYRRSPAHAVGYADGSASLLTVEEYRRLDRSNLVPLADWIQSRKAEKPTTSDAELTDEREP